MRSAPKSDGDRSMDDRCRALERRIRDIEREIERRELAAEIERQSDA